MKACTYCETKYDLKDVECPSCGSSDYKIECDKCHTIHNENSCPNCGNGTVKKLMNCSKCGFQTDERICPSCGYDTMSIVSVKDSVASVIAVGACQLSGHKFVGCKCTRCGKIRVTGHDYKPVANKCKKECSICGHTVETPHKWSNGTCTRCGEKKGFIDKLLDSIGQKLPLLHLEKENNRGVFSSVVAVLSCLILLGILGFIESTPNSNGEIRLPSVLSDYNDENIDSVVNELKDDGFTNVTTVALGDLIFGWLNEEGEVASVTVGGKKEFESSGRYPTDVEIIIEYHSFPTTDEDETIIDKIDESNEDSKNEPYVYIGQEYEIVDTYKTGIGLTQYWIYTSSFDYSTEEYKQKVKEIIIDLAYISGTTDISVEVVTDKEIIYFESDTTIAKYMNKYGIDYFNKVIVPKEIIGYIASYRGGYDPGTSQLSKSDSAYEVTWFIASDDLETEKWKPELIP